MDRQHLMKMAMLALAVVAFVYMASVFSKKDNVEKWANWWQKMVVVPLIENKVMSKLVRTIFTNILTVKINNVIIKTLT